MWNDYHTDFLINERRNRNEEFYTINGCSKVTFWDSIATKINLEFQTLYTGRQCREKFQNLVRDHMVRKITDYCNCF
jgi:hypothetical protein